MNRLLALLFVSAFITANVVGQNTNSSATGKPRATGTNTNKSANPPKPADASKPPPPPQAVRTVPVRPKVATPPAAPGADAVLAAFERLLNGIRKADVKMVTGVYLNSSSLILFNNNGTLTRGWEQMRKNRESSYPDLKDVKLDVRDLAVTMLGRDGAVVTCFWTQSQTYKSVPETATGRMTLVFKRVGPEWKAVHLHTSPDKPDPSRLLPSEESSETPTSSPTPKP